MSALQARQAALELQTELIELDIDVELNVKEVKKNFGTCGDQLLKTAVLEVDVGLGPSKPATIYIGEDGSIWGKTTLPIFVNQPMAFNSTVPWRPSALAQRVKAALPQLRQFQESQDRLLKIIKKKIK